MRITFVDTGILICSVRGEADLAQRALEILDDPEREFASSPFVRLEVLPKPVFEGRQEEVEVYEQFFSLVRHWAPANEELVKDAYALAAKDGLNAMDALHVAAAVAVKADVLVTTEKPSKPIHRTKAVSVHSIYT